MNPKETEKKEVNKPETKPRENLKNVNLLHLFLGSTKPQALKKMKVIFAAQLHDAIVDEKMFCSITKAEPMMKGATLSQVESLLEGCKNVWDVEALAQLLFDNNMVPTKEELIEKSRTLQALWPAQELLQ